MCPGDGVLFTCPACPCSWPGPRELLAPREKGREDEGEGARTASQGRLEAWRFSAALMKPLL